MTAPIPSYHSGGREYKAALMSVIGQLLDDTPPDQWPPGPLIGHVIKKAAVERGLQMPRRVDNSLRSLADDGYLAIGPNGGLRLLPPGINYLYDNGYLRRFFRRPEPAAVPERRVYVLKKESE